MAEAWMNIGRSQSYSKYYNVKNINTTKIFELRTLNSKLSKLKFINNQLKTKYDKLDKRLTEVNIEYKYLVKEQLLGLFD